MHFSPFVLISLWLKTWWSPSPWKAPLTGVFKHAGVCLCASRLTRDQREPQQRSGEGGRQRDRELQRDRITAARSGLDRRPIEFHQYTHGQTPTPLKNKQLCVQLYSPHPDHILLCVTTAVFMLTQHFFLEFTLRTALFDWLSVDHICSQRSSSYCILRRAAHYAPQRPSSVTITSGLSLSLAGRL